MAEENKQEQTQVPQEVVAGEFKHNESETYQSYEYTQDNSEANAADEQKSLDALAKQEAELARVEPENIPESQKADPEPEQKTEQEAPSEEKAEVPEGLDYEKFTNEYLDNGSLSEDSYAELEKLGLHKSLVDSHIAGLEARQQVEEQAAFNLVGGQDKYQDMLTWAGNHLNQEGINEFNDLVAKGGRDRERAIKELHQQYQDTYGIQGEMLQGSTGPASASTGYKSMAELIAAQSDPRYATDPAYRDDVWRKLERSTF